MTLPQKIVTYLGAPVVAWILGFSVVASFIIAIDKQQEIAERELTSIR